MKKVLGTGMDLGKFWLASRRIRQEHSDPAARRKAFVENMRAYAGTILERMSIKVTHVGEENLGQTQAPRLVVANHMSYIDIPILIQALPTLFVTSVELQQTFFLGDIAEAGGSLFVERRQPARLKKDLVNVGKVLEEGFNLVVFPEGTSGDGETVKPFRPGLFAVASQLEIPVQPLCIKYVSINGEPFSRENHERVCWYNNMRFAPHFWRLQKVSELEVELHFLDPILPSKDMDKRLLAQQAHERVLKTYHSRE